MSDRQDMRLAIVFVMSLLTLVLAGVLYAAMVCTAVPIALETLSAVETVQAILEQTPTPEGAR